VIGNKQQVLSFKKKLFTHHNNPQALLFTQVLKPQRLVIFFPTKLRDTAALASPAAFFL